MRFHLAFQLCMAIIGTFVNQAELASGLETSVLDAPQVRFPDIVNELGPQLSQNATVLVRSSSRFLNATQRWQTYHDPSFSAIVEVAVESDIAKTVSYANNHSIPFLAINGAHGAIESLKPLGGAIGIRLGAMNDVQISADGTYATIQGGVTNKRATDMLWAAKKQSTTGAGECSGFTGAGLGGGHGFLQGQYGLIADNIIEARLILGNGSIIIASASSNPDLFYAIRGAGHNFGILSEMKYRVYDVPPNDSWYYENFIFGGDQVESLFRQVNYMMANGSQPAELINYAAYLRSPTNNASNVSIPPQILEGAHLVKAVILFSILYNGPAMTARKYTTPYHALSPLTSSNGTTDLTGLAAVTGNDEKSQVCQNGFNRLKFPINIQKYNISAQRATFDAFNNFTSHDAFNSSLLIFEAYSLNAVTAVPDASTAFSQRNDRIIVTPVISYLRDSSFDARAVAFGKNVRHIINAASGNTELHAYVNYAHGDETKQQLYGYEPWRIPRLQHIKTVYDPQNRFRWFAPIV